MEAEASASSLQQRGSSNGGGIPRRPSETANLVRRDSSGSTINSSTPEAGEARRKSSVFANQGQWKAAEANGVSSSGTSTSRKSSIGSVGSAARRPSDNGGDEISFGNGEYTSLSPRGTSTSPTNVRRLSATSVHSESKEEKSTGDTITGENGLSAVERLRRRSSSNTAADAQKAPIVPQDAPILTRQVSDKSTISELPPLPPSNSGKRFASIIAGAKSKVPSKLRSMVRRTSGERAEDSGDDGQGGEADEGQGGGLTPSSSQERDLSGHYNEYEESDIVLSPGRSRIYTIDQARRSSFLPVNRIKNESSGEFGLGPRRGSVRLSEADVGFLLGKVSKISADTLRQAAMEGNSSLCEALVRGAVPIDETDLKGKTALMLAAEHGRGDTTAHLLSLGAAVEIRDDEGMTALHLAVKNTKLSCVKALLAAAADCNLLAANGDSGFTIALQRVEQSLALDKDAERRTEYAHTSEVCRVMLREFKGKPSINREKLKKSTLFLLDEWVRAKAAGEVLVVPPMEKLMDGERSLITFLKEHRQRVKIITAIKIWFVVVFIGFDLATRDMTMTPARILTYIVLYVGAYYL